MRILESHLRCIIREEINRKNRIETITSVQTSGLMRETWDISAILREPSIKDLSVVNQMKYIAARTLGDATETGAKAIAKGEVDVIPSVGEALENAWNSSIMDWTLTSLGAIADFIPGPGTVVSLEISKIQLLKALSAKPSPDWLGAALAAISAFPIVGDSLGILSRAVRAGVKVPKLIARNAAQILAKITDGQIIDAMARTMQDVPEMAASAAVAVRAAAKTGAAEMESAMSQAKQLTNAKKNVLEAFNKFKSSLELASA